MKKKWRQFIDAKKFVRKLNLSSTTEWRKFCKLGKKPDDIPSHPHIIYKKEWKDWRDFLGTKNTATQKRIYRSFESARKFVHLLGLESTNKWRDYGTSGKKPDDIPSHPHIIYKNKGWVSWGDWLGTKKIATHKIKFRVYDDAKKSVHSFNIKSQRQWNEFRKSKKLPKDIPSSPQRTYKNNGWIGWGDWLGTGNLATKIRYTEYLSWKEAKLLYRKIAKDNKINSREDWRKYVKIHNLPKGLPTYPEFYTKERVWKMIQK